MFGIQKIYVYLKALANTYNILNIQNQTEQNFWNRTILKVNKQLVFSRSFGFKVWCNH